MTKRPPRTPARPTSQETKRALVLLTWAQQPIKNVAAVARKCKVARATVTRWVRRLQQGFLPTDKPRSGRPRKLGAAGVQFLKQWVPALGTAARLAASVSAQVPGQKPVSAETVRRTLKAEGYRWKRCRYRIKLTAAHETARLKYARALRDAGRAWRQILFTDSAYFYCDRGVCKWLPASEMNDQASERYPNKVHVYGGMSYTGKVGLWCVTGTSNHTPIVPLEKGQRGANGKEYRALLKQCMLPAARELYRGQDWYFMQDGARIHTAKLTMQLLKEEGVRVWAHPARSPDLNPIEHMWHLVKCEMRGLKFETVGELKQGVEEAWGAIPQEKVHGLVTSMGRRCRAVIQAKGGLTRY